MTLIPVYSGPSMTAGAAGGDASGVIRRTDFQSGTLDATGSYTFTFEAASSSILVERITAAVASGTVDVTVYVGSVGLSNIVDYVSGVLVAVGDQVSPIYIPAGNKLVVVLSAGTAGVACAARLQILEG